MMNRNKAALKGRFGRYLNIDEHWNQAISIGKEERSWLLAHQKISFEQLLATKPWNNGHSPDWEQTLQALTTEILENK